jgi:REP element-mobilizing transposase RayT
MPRKRREESDEGFFHVTTHSVEFLDLYANDGEREVFLLILDRMVRKFELVVHTYVLMTNHYHLLVSTPKANLADSMEMLNGKYAMWVNRLRRRRGHVFDARYNPIPVVTDEHLKEVARYVVLNPVRAGICARAEDWPWSAHRALAGLTRAPRFLTSTTILGAFHDEPARAQAAYAKFVAAGSPYASLEGILALASPAEAA